MVYTYSLLNIMATERDNYLFRLLRDAVEAGAFGIGKQYRKFLKSSFIPMKGFRSEQHIGILMCSDRRNNTDSDLDDDNENRTNVFVKTIIDEQSYADDGEFFNELVTYQLLAPYFGQIVPSVNGLFAKFYYGAIEMTANQRCRGGAVMENLTVAGGYRQSSNLVHLDREHMIMMMKKLGEFHACSYVGKNKHPIYFRSLVNKLTDPIATKADQMRDINKFIFERVVMATLKDDPLYREQLHHLADIANDPLGFVVEVRRRKNCDGESISVLCHGDFLATNVLFSYDDDDIIKNNNNDINKNNNDINNNDNRTIIINDVHRRRPTGIKFVDFGCTVYGTLAIDLSNVLTVHTDPTERIKYWPEYVRIYYEALRSHVPADICIPDEDRIMNEVRDNAGYGLGIASNFLAVLMSKKRLDGSTFLNISYDDTEGHRFFVERGIKRYFSVSSEVDRKALVDIAKNIIDIKTGII